MTRSQHGPTASPRAEGSAAAMRPASPGSQAMTESLDNEPPLLLAEGAPARITDRHAPHVRVAGGTDTKTGTLDRIGGRRWHLGLPRACRRPLSVTPNFGPQHS